MKRITSLLLAIGLTISVAGCGSKEADQTGPALTPDDSAATTSDAGSGTAGSAEKPADESADAAAGGEKEEPATEPAAQPAAQPATDAPAE